jgi:hypothetical protein
MTLAFGVFMAEAVLTYEAPVVPAPRYVEYWMNKPPQEDTQC